MISDSWDITVKQAFTTGYISKFYLHYLEISENKFQNCNSQGHVVIHN